MSEPTISFAAQLREFLRRNANWFLAAALGLLLLQDVFGTHGVLAMRRAQKEATAVQQEINLINEENRQLQDRVKSLKTDPQAIEHIARAEMGLARAGLETLGRPSLLTECADSRQDVRPAPLPSSAGHRQ